MESYIVMDYNFFIHLLEDVHNCLSGKNAKLKEETFIIDRSEVEFECCQLQIDMSLVNTFKSLSEMQSLFEVSKNNDEWVAPEIISVDENVNSLSCDTPTPSVAIQDTNDSMEDPLCIDAILPLRETAKTYLLKDITKNLPKIAGNASIDIHRIDNCPKIDNRVKYPDLLICEYCGKEFRGKDRAYLCYYHRNKVHTKEVMYKCETCNKVYWSERALSVHMLIHDKPNHICHICGMVFNRKGEYSRHLLTHQEGKNICSFCAKLFCRKDQLKIHEMVHTGNYPNNCAYCGSGFAQKHQLKAHLKRCPTLMGKKSKYSKIDPKKEVINEVKEKPMNEVEEELIEIGKYREKHKLPVELSGECIETLLGEGQWESNVLNDKVS